MKNKLIGIFLFVALVSVSPLKAEVESWYAYWSFGFADNTYPQYLQDAFDTTGSLPGVERTEISLDMFGFYWPVMNQNTLFGFVINSASDRLDDGFNYLQLNQYLYAFSAMHFFGNEPGDGFFIRGDMGMAKSVLDSNFSTVVYSDSGTGYLLGAGYGFPLSDRSRLMLSVNYSSRTIENEDTSTVSMNVGILW